MASIPLSLTAPPPRHAGIRVRQCAVPLSLLIRGLIEIPRIPQRGDSLLPSYTTPPFALFAFNHPVKRLFECFRISRWFIVSLFLWLLINLCFCGLFHTSESCLLICVEDFVFIYFFFFGEKIIGLFVCWIVWFIDGCY